MKTTRAINGLIVGASLVLASAASAVTFSFSPYEYAGGLPNSDLDPIVINGELTDGGGGTVLFTILNDSSPGDDWVTSDRPTITKIGFEDLTDTISNGSIDSWLGVVNFHQDNGVNIPGSNNISFNTEFGWVADPPPTTNGIDPGESITFRFDGTLADVHKALSDGDLRIAVHVQQITDNDTSAAYVNDGPPPPPDDEVPEPSSGVLVFLTSLGFLIRRRR